MRDVLAGAIATIAEVTRICETASNVQQVKRKVEIVRDTLLKMAADDFAGAMPRKLREKAR
jgi:hypothetical protein